MRYGTYVEPSNSIFRFKSDISINGLGFQIEYNTSHCDNTSNVLCNFACRDYSTPSGLLTSAHYPNPYPDNSECTYTISQGRGTYINLTIRTFDIEESESEGTCYDYLEIRDGDSEDSPLMGKFCGTNIPQFMHSTNNFLWIR